MAKVAADGIAETVNAGAKACIDRIIKLVPAFMVIGYELFLLMLLCFQMQSFYICKEGAVCSRVRVLGAGVAGLLFTLLPFVCIIRKKVRECYETIFDEDRCGGTWISWFARGIVLVLHTGFFTTFIVFMCLPIESTALLKDVAAEIRFVGDCAGGKLLEVRENLTFSVDEGFTTTAQRKLRNQAEPDQISVQWIGGATNLAIESVDRKDPKKFSMDYETGHHTTVRIKFDRHSKPQNGSTFSLQLRYLARPYGDLGDCSDGGAVCSKDSGQVEVKGWWQLWQEDDVSASVSLAGCTTANCAGWQATGGPLSKKDDNYKLEFRAPSSLGIGTDSCPLAWSLGSRNLWWVLTAVCLAVAAFGCLVLVYGGGDAAVPILACMACFLLLAIVFFVFALVSDFFASDDAKG